MKTPRNEIELIVLFAQQAQEHGIEIMSVNSTGFPDAAIKIGSSIYRAEFEYKSSNFWLHTHNPADCDLIICWANDDDCSVLPIMALSDDEWWKVEVTHDEAKEVRYWKKRALEAEKLVEIRGGRRPKDDEEVTQKIIGVFEEMTRNGERISYNQISRRVFRSCGGGQTERIRRVIGDL